MTGRALASEYQVRQSLQLFMPYFQVIVIRDEADYQKLLQFFLVWLIFMMSSLSPVAMSIENLFCFRKSEQRRCCQEHLSWWSS